VKEVNGQKKNCSVAARKHLSQKKSEDPGKPICDVATGVSLTRKIEGWEEQFGGKINKKGMTRTPKVLGGNSYLKTGNQ